MSVPQSAAANYAVVDSGLLNIHQQEEQYHRQQQQQQELHNQYYSHNTNTNIVGGVNSLAKQQQLMQQLASMASSATPNSPLYLSATTLSGLQNNLETEDQVSIQQSSSVAVMAEGAADGNDNAEMQNEWIKMSDGGRYGTPGAAGLEYQKYEQQHQQQQTPANNYDDQSMKPSDMDNANNNNVHNQKNLEDELNALSSNELYHTLKEYDLLQDKYHTVLLLPKESNREVTAGGRDGSAYVLRCLKIWYELPSDVLFCAMSLVDRFLDRMAVKPKHMACMIVASFHLAIKQLNLKPIPAEDLVKISQCGCTAGDLERMANVIANKLGVQFGQPPITSVSYLRIYYALFRNLARDIGGSFFEFYTQLIKLKDLENRLEILLCDVKTTVISPSTLALVLICLHLDFHIKESYTKGSPELKHVFEYILFLQQYMRIPDRIFTCGFSIVSGILSHYNGQNKQPYKQRLVWRLSSRTLRVLRPINRFSSDLPTIEEGIPNSMDEEGLRARTESISSEEEEDWPTSPVIPIFETC